LTRRATSWLREFVNFQRMGRLAELYLLSQGLSYVLKRQSNILITWAKPKWAEELKNQEKSSKKLQTLSIKQ